MHELHMNVPINAIFENDATNAKKIVAFFETSFNTLEILFFTTYHYFLSKALLEFPYRCAKFVGVESHSAPAVLYLWFLFS